LNSNKNIEYLNCPFDNQFTGAIIFQEHPNYKIYQQLFLKYGLAIKLDDQKQVIFDGQEILNQNLNLNHIHYIFGHEIGHHILNHHARRNRRHEMEADWAAVLICLRSGNKSAAMLAKYEFYNRYGFTYLELAVSQKKKDIIQEYLETIYTI
jgi:hypothetical protein